MKKIIILFIMILSLNLFAEDWVAAIRNERTQIAYIDYDIAGLNANSGDTFSLGEWNSEISQYRITNSENSLKIRYRSIKIP